MNKIKIWVGAYIIVTSIKHGVIPYESGPTIRNICGRIVCCTLYCPGDIDASKINDKKVLPITLLLLII